MEDRWRDIAYYVPTRVGWYFVCIGANGVALRSLSRTESGQGTVTYKWDFGERLLNESLAAYRYWQPVIIPAFPGSWQDIAQDAPPKVGWYLVASLAAHDAIVITLRSLSRIEVGQEETSEFTWDFGELYLNEPLTTYHYWQPIVFPNPPGSRSEDPLLTPSLVENTLSATAEVLIADAISHLTQLLEFLCAAAYAGNEVADIVKICCNIGRSIEIGIRARELLHRVLEED